MGDGMPALPERQAHRHPRNSGRLQGVETILEVSVLSLLPQALHEPHLSWTPGPVQPGVHSRSSAGGSVWILEQRTDITSTLKIGVVLLPTDVVHNYNTASTCSGKIGVTEELRGPDLSPRNILNPMSATQRAAKTLHVTVT